VFALRQTLRKKAEETRVSSAFVFINAFCSAKSYLLKIEQRTPRVIPKSRRVVPRRDERISQKFRRIFALDVST
jgi:hypothetical protein